MTKEEITMICQCCNKQHKVLRTADIPSNAEVGWCNYCPECEDKMTDYYDEWWYDYKGQRI